MSTADFFKGTHYFLQGLKALTSSRIRPFVWVPICINIILFAALFYYGLSYLYHKFSFIFFTLPKWLNWLNWLVKPIQYFIMTWAITMALSIIAIVSTTTANIIAAPFNGLLSESYSKLLGFSVPPIAFHKMVIKTLGRELKKLFYFVIRFLLIGLICVLFYFVPFLKLTIPFLLFLFGSWMAVVEYSDYSADNFHQPFNQSLQILKENRMQSFGFGAMVMLMGSIPFVNFIVMPAAVLGGTALWHAHAGAHLK